jgi:hypothetical protein
MEDEPRLNAGFDPTSSLRMKQMQTAVIRIGNWANAEHGHLLAFHRE